jgi:hypothetical protein
MASWLQEGKQPPQAVLGIIVGRMHRVAHPLYLGAISLYIGWSLDRTQQMMDVLHDRGIVVQLTPEQLVAAGMRDDGIVYRLTERPSPSKARH